MKSRLLGVLVRTALGTVGVATAASGTVASEATHGGRPLHATLLPQNQSPPTASNGSGTSLYYVNVHTTMFPAGEVRGQLG